MVWARRTLLKVGRRTRQTPSGTRVYNISTRTREASERGLHHHHHHMMVVTGSAESRLFVATVTTGAMAAMAAATMGFYKHEAAVARLLLLSPDNNAGNARVEGRLSKMEQSMQQQ